MTVQLVPLWAVCRVRPGPSYCMGSCGKWHGRALLAPCRQRLRHCLCCPSSFSWFAILDGTTQNLNGLAGGRRCGKPRALLQGYCTASSLVEMTSKGNEVLWAENLLLTASRGLATSHWINSTLSIPEFLYTSLYLTYHNWPKLSGFSLMTVKSHQPSNCHGWGITMK